MYRNTESLGSSSQGFFGLSMLLGIGYPALLRGFLVSLCVSISIDSQ